MSTKCKIWDCDNLISCPCFGMCGLHTAANATWQCDHLSGKAFEPVAVEPVAVEPVAVEPVAVEPVAVEPVAEPPPVMLSILRPAYALPDVVEDETPSPLKTPEPNDALADNDPQPDPVETLAALHTEHMSQIMAEMEAMRAKLKEYEEQKAIIENIQQLEAKCAKLETPAKNEIPTKAAFANVIPGKPNTARSASTGPAKRQTLQKIASSNSNVGPKSTAMQTKQKK